MLEKLKIKFSKKKKKSKFTIIEVVVIFLVTMIISLSMGTFLGYKILGSTSNQTYSQELKKFIDNYQYIIDNYYGEVDEEILTDSALKGLLEAIGDPYSNFLDEEGSTSDVYLDGSFRGVGIEVRQNSEGNIRVDNIFENSPADKSGMKIGDVIIKIDDLDLRGKLPAELTSYVRTQNDEMTLKVLRKEETLTFKLKKDLVIIKSVTSKILNENEQKLGYIKVDIFSATTYGQFEKALKELEKENINGLIIDFRSNSGGHLSTVSNMMSLFLKKDKIMYQTETRDEIKKIYSKGKSEKKYDVVFLVNKETASAPEVMISALRDNLDSKIVGETTFGKGTVQEIQTLTDGNQYKLTVKKWLTPKGEWIHGKGVKPDYEISLDEEYLKNPILENDNQLNKAIELFKK